MRIAICDDDITTLQSISKLLKLAYVENGLTWQEPHCFNNAKDLLSSGSYDLIYLDIEMPNMSGLEAAAQLRTQNRHTQLVFITSHTNYVFDTFRVMPIDFLAKPINCQQFLETFQCALKNYRWQHQTITCQSLGETLILPVSDICYIGSQGKKVQIHLQNGDEYCINERISHISPRLTIHHIIRCHRFYLVNLAYVQGIFNRQSFQIGQRSEGKEVYLSVINTYLPIGEKYLEGFEQSLLYYQEQGRTLY